MTTDIKHSLIHSAEDISDNMDTTINETQNHLLSRYWASLHVVTKIIYVQ